MAWPVAFDGRVARTPRPSLVTTYWTLHRPGRTAQCVLYTHGAEWELSLQGEHSFPRSRICLTREDVVARQEQWKATLERDGWRASI
jgi:hypothetical protein